jgi:hypothetical protein
MASGVCKYDILKAAQRVINTCLEYVTCTTAISGSTVWCLSERLPSAELGFAAALTKHTAHGVNTVFCVGSLWIHALASGRVVQFLCTSIHAIHGIHVTKGPLKGPNTES